MTNVTPSWAADPVVIYSIDVAGWRDRYIRMPVGAKDDVFRVESTGQTLYLTGDTTQNGNSDGTWTTAGSVDFTYTAVAGNTLDTILNALTAAINNHASYDAVRSGNSIIITTGAGVASVVVTGAAPVINNPSNTDANYDRTLDSVAPPSPSASPTG